MLSLIVAYRSFRRFRQASTRLDTPPLSIRHHPGSVIAPEKVTEGVFTYVAIDEDGHPKTLLAKGAGETH